MNCTEDVLEYWMGRVTAALDLDQEKLIDRLSISDQVHCFLFCQALQAQALDAIDTRMVRADLLLHEIINLLEGRNDEVCDDE